MKRFSSTIGFIGDRQLLVNGERILFVERLSEPDRYAVHFDTGEVLEIEEVSGRMLVDHLEDDGESYIPAPQVSFQPTSRPPHSQRRR